MNKESLSFLLASWSVPFVPGPVSQMQQIPGATDAFATAFWAIKAASPVLCTALMILCAMRLHREDYTLSLMSFLGAVLAGLSPLLAQVFLFHSV